MGDICKSFQCIVDADLSSVTKRVYLERLRYMIQQTKTELQEIIVHPEKYLEWVEKHSSSMQTQKSYISAILAVFKHTPGLKEKEKKVYYEWYQGFKKVHEQIDHKYKQNEPSPKQKEAYVVYSDIVAKRDSLAKGSKERLLLSMYTYLPPLRSDFNQVYIYQKSQKTYDHENYILLFDPPTLVLNEFKTMKKKDGYEKILPEELVEEIKESLKKEPRDWLFMDRSKQPYKSGSFTKWANRTLKSLFKKALTISLIRHSYINQLDFNKLTVQEKEEIAKDMAHTVNTQDRYRLIFS
jgi:hypothetical protein